MGKDFSSLYDGSSLNNKDVRLINRELANLYKRILATPLDEVYMIKYKGVTFDCLPFLLNGSSYFSDSYRSTLLDKICEKTPEIGVVHLRDLKGIDLDVMHSLYPSSSDYAIRYLGAYLNEKDARLFLRLMLHGAAEVYQAVVYNTRLIHFDFQCEGICNTQAFSYYMSILWLLHYSPMLMTLSRKYLKSIDFFNLVDSFCPEGSLHYRYIHGELTSKELFKAYESEVFEDGSSVALREAFSCATEGTYSGGSLSEQDLFLAKEIYDLDTRDEDYKFNMHLAYCYLFDGSYRKQAKEIENLHNQLEVAKDLEQAQRNKVVSIRAELIKYKKEIIEKNKEISNLRGSLSSVVSDKALKSELDALRLELKTLQSENNTLFNERLALKQEVSTQKKQLKSMSASLNRLKEQLPNFDENSEDTVQELSFDEICTSLLDKSIILVGFDNNKSLCKKFEQAGFKGVAYFDLHKRTLKNCDYLVVLTSCCSHAQLYKAESQLRGSSAKSIYTQSINFESIVRQIYEEEISVK